MAHSTNVTPEQLQHIAAMHVADRIQKYLPMLIAGGISKKHYDFIIDYPYTPLPVADGASTAEDTQGDLQQGGGGAAQEAGPASGPDTSIGSSADGGSDGGDKKATEVAKEIAKNLGAG